MKNDLDLQDLESGHRPAAAPPPYSLASPLVLNPHTAGMGYAPYPAPAPVGGYLETSLTVQPDPLSAVMNSHSTFVVEQTETLSGCRRSPVMIHVLDETGGSVMSTMVDEGTVVGRNHNGHQIHTRSSISFMDTTGRIVMVATETATSLTLTSGDRMLGVVDGCIGLFAGSLVPKNLSGLPLCAVQKVGDAYKFVRADGTEMGHAGLNSVGAFELRLSPTLDANTKAILLVTGYMLYYLYYVNTSCGIRGGKNFGICLCMLFCLTPMVIFGIIVGIIMGVVT